MPRTFFVWSLVLGFAALVVPSRTFTQPKTTREPPLATEKSRVTSGSPRLAAGDAVLLSMQNTTPLRALRLLEELTNESITFDLDAVPVAGCSGLSLERRDYTGEEARRAILDEVRRFGLIVEERDDVVAIRRDPRRTYACESASPRGPGVGELVSRPGGVAQLRRAARARVAAELMTLRAIQSDRSQPNVRVYGVRRDSWPGALGLENGDRVVSLAGRRVSTPADLVAAAEAIKAIEGSFELEVERDGKRAKRTVRIVEY